MKVTYSYRYCDRNHVWTTRDIPGLLVSNPDLRTSYAMIPGVPQMPVDDAVAFIAGPSALKGQSPGDIAVLAATGFIFEIE